MGRRRRSRRGWRRIGERELADLERALRGGEPNLAPQQAAAELAQSRAGARLLRRIIAASGAPAGLREAAVYGFLWGYTRSADLALVRHVFENEREAPSVRGQAAEVLGSHFHHSCRPGHRRHARLVCALVRGLDDPSPEVRFWSIYALARPEHTWLLPKLELMAATDTASCPGMWTLRQEALWAIRWITLADLHCDPRTLQ